MFTSRVLVDLGVNVLDVAGEQLVEGFRHVADRLEGSRRHEPAGVGGQSPGGDHTAGRVGARGEGDLLAEKQKNRKKVKRKEGDAIVQHPRVFLSLCLPALCQFAWPCFVLLKCQGLHFPGTLPFDALLFSLCALAA